MAECPDYGSVSPKTFNERCRSGLTGTFFEGDSSSRCVQGAMRISALVLPLLVLPLVHCAMLLPPPAQGSQGVQEPENEPQTPAGGGAGPLSPRGPEGSTSGSPHASAQTRAAAPVAHAPASVEIHSDCPKTTPVFYGDKPKFGSGTRSSIGSNTTTTAGRKADGSLTVWIIDDQENGIASVQVAPTTRRVEIDRSCRQISAR